jgi:hypothetical protein
MRTRESHRGHALNLHVGEVVEVRTESEILATLDENGELESLPFMPEMLQFCGQQFRVDKLAVKLCDTINWTGMYRMRNAVHLEGVRCDGQAHGGCQAGCLVYWKEAWLKRPEATGHGVEPAARCTSAMLTNATRNNEPPASSGEERYSCQATELLRAAPTYVPSWDVRQYALDVRSGNSSAPVMMRSVLIGAFNEFQDFSRRFLPRPLRIRGGKRFPVIEGRLRKSPEESLNLKPGELVRVKRKEEILETLDTNNKNRGLSFDVEMLKYCGQTAQVLRRVEKIIDEKTGRMVHMKNPCIILAGVICTADYHRLCPRSIYPYWREIWLERAR